jgi:hypothetical protein
MRYYRFVREYRDLETVRDGQRCRPQDVFLEFRESRCDPVRRTVFGGEDVLDPGRRLTLDQHLFRAHEDHDGLAGLGLDFRFRQLYFLGRVEHLDGTGVHEQEEHEDREHVHQRRQVHLRDLHAVARHAFDTPRVPHGASPTDISENRA